MNKPQAGIFSHTASNVMWRLLPNTGIIAFSDSPDDSWLLILYFLVGDEYSAQLASIYD